MTVHRPDARAATAAAAGGLAFAVAGVLVATQGPFEGELASTVEYVTDIGLAIGLACTAAALLVLGPALRAPGPAVLAAVVGQSLILLGVLAGLALGEDPAWFGVVAAPGLLLWLGGTVVIGIGAWRGRLLPRPAAALVALMVPVGVVPFGEVGGTAVIGLLWLWLAARVLRPAPAPARAAGYAEAG